jgi:lipopolysaccharide/colanic/teichoic acid biosynthesis glycosyltransferase
MHKIGTEYLKGQHKRRLDLLGGLALAGALLPVIASTAAVSAADTRSRNPFLSQSRIGIEGKPFNIIKLRTIPDALTNIPSETYGTFDTRASKIGRQIRKFGLDEMPQLANVIGGQMSLVGIRPLLESDFDRLSDADPVLFDDWHDAYKDTKPGLTGPGQIYRHHYRTSTPEVYAQSMRLDMEYVEKASLKSDIKILTGTPAALMNANVRTIENADQTAAA